MDNPPEPLAHYWTSSTTLKRLPEDYLPKYEAAPPEVMYLVKPLNVKTPQYMWGICAVFSGLLGILAGFILGSFLEFGNDS